MLDNYLITHHGIVKQSKIFYPVTYDVEYVRQRYDQYATTRQLSLLRLKLLCDNIILKKDNKILDVGYGNGDFLEVCQRHGYQAFGYDISGYSLPRNTIIAEDIFADAYDCITFFDSLEHMPVIDFIHKLSTSYVAISVPWCHYISDEWFLNWKHRRPDEHIFHFDHISLSRFMCGQGFRLLYIGNPEDTIRKPLDHLPNILTAIFQKRQRVIQTSMGAIV